MTKINIQKGGKVIASGGFGCIFEPALKCVNGPSTGELTKLMTKKHAEDEYKQIQDFKKILENIPNYSEYFLIDGFSICQPKQLINNDLKKFNKKCTALTKKNITKKNVNKSLSKLLAINMPDGGINISDFISNYFVSSNLIRLNNSLINLLVHGIIPMNKLNVYHCDIKDSNVLVKISETYLNTRLIDWGLSIHHKILNGIPRKLYRRPFQYNVPFSVILFNKEFTKHYNNFLQINLTPDYFSIREFVINYIFIWNDIRGPGHLSAINDIIKKLTLNELAAIKKKKIKNHLIEYDFTYYYIIEYISKILFKYTANGKFELLEYFNKIFIKTIDIWGFVMIYISLFEKIYEDYKNLNSYQMEFINKIKYIIIHFLFESPTSLIDIDKLINELTSLNNLIDRFDENLPPKKNVYSYLITNTEEIGGENKKINIKKTRKRKNK